MQWRALTVIVATACAAAIAGGSAVVGQAPQGRGGGGGGRGGVGAGLFTAMDANKDGAVTGDEMKAAFDRWYTEWDTTKSNALTQEQLVAGLTAALPPPPPAPGFTGGAGRGAAPQPQTPDPAHVQAMIAALPAAAPAKPKQARKVLVLAKAAGFVHSSIPLAARTIEEMGKKYGTWTTTITYDPADINEANLKQYDAIFLASTTGAFLDEPTDAAATAARRKALLDFVRGGKGLAGIHAASDSYHQNRPDPNAPRRRRPARPRRRWPWWADRTGRRAVHRAGRQERRSEAEPGTSSWRCPRRGSRSWTPTSPDGSRRPTSRSGSPRT